MTNWEITNNLLHVKTLLELTHKYKLASLYEHAAYTISILDHPLDAQNLLFLPEGVREDVHEILTTGSFSLKDNLEKGIPKSLRQVASLPGLRIENAIKLYNSLKIESLADLKRAINDGTIKNNREFGQRFEEQLRRILIQFEKDPREVTIFEGYSYSKSLIISLKNTLKIHSAGSIRRGKEIANNINFVVCGDIEKSKSKIEKFIEVKNSTTNMNTLTIKDKQNIVLKFHSAPEEYFYSALLYFTGSKLHNKVVNEIAKSKGIKTSKDGYLLINAKSEEEVYEKLGMQYIPPEIRESEEEIELARSFSLPELIKESDIKGDLHIHSDFSDGTSTLREIKEEASLKNYDFIAITDHSQNLKIGRGLPEQKLLKEFAIIDKINKEGDRPFLLKGIEAEIDMKGLLDYKSTLNDKFDIVIGAIHMFSQTDLQNTDRLKKAIESRRMNVIAHPTGRIIHTREPIPVNLKEVIEVAVQNNVALEINLFPTRIDLSSGLIKEAKSIGARYFSVGSDAHNAGHLNFTDFGIKVLKRAGMKSNEIINNMDTKELKEFLWMSRH